MTAPARLSALSPLLCTVLLVLYCSTVVNSQGPANSNYQKAQCDPYMLDVYGGASCKDFVYPSGQDNTTAVPASPAAPMGAVPPVGIAITAGDNANQIAFTTYPLNVAKSFQKPTALALASEFDDYSGETINNWPYCAAKGQECTCANGYVALIFNNDQWVISQGKGSVKCDLDVIVEDPKEQKGIGELSNDRKMYYTCKCGRPITQSEQWQWATALCPALNVPWRPWEDEKVYSCQGIVRPFDSEYTQSAMGRNLYGAYAGGLATATGDDSAGASSPFPMTWIGLQSTKGGSAIKDSTHTFKLNVPSTQDNQAVFKFIDTKGDGWEGGELSMYKNVNDRTTAGLVPITRSWTRQDSYVTERGSEEGPTGDQSSGGRTCHKRWLIDNKAISATHQACRQRCRVVRGGDVKSCTHYAWSATGRDESERYNHFNDDGPPVATGKCYLYHVDYDMVLINNNDWLQKHHPDQFTANQNGGGSDACNDASNDGYPATGDGQGETDWSNEPSSDEVSPVDPRNMFPGTETTGTTTGTTTRKDSCPIFKVTWSAAKEECTSRGPGFDLCTRDELCHGTVPMWKPDSSYKMYGSYEMAIATKGAVNMWTTMKQKQSVFNPKTGFVSTPATCTKTEPTTPTWGQDAEKRYKPRSHIMCCRSSQQSDLNKLASHAAGGAFEHIPDCFTQPGERVLTARAAGREDTGGDDNGKNDRDDPMLQMGDEELNAAFHANERYAIFKHKFPGFAKPTNTFVAHKRKPMSRGEEFEATLPSITCPKGYYCPNQVPKKCSSDQCPEATVANYYEGDGATAVMQIKCANFPFNGEGTPGNEDAW